MPWAKASGKAAAAWYQLNAIRGETNGNRQPVGDNQHTIAHHRRHLARVATGITLFTRRPECGQEEVVAWSALRTNSAYAEATLWLRSTQTRIR
jgi:hypothetical protein